MFSFAQVIANVDLYGVRIFRFRGTDKMGLDDEADGAMPPDRIFGLEPPLTLLLERRLR